MTCLGVDFVNRLVLRLRMPADQERKGRTVVPFVLKERNRREQMEAKEIGGPKVSSIFINDLDSIVFNAASRSHLVPFEPDDFVTAIDVTIGRFDDEKEEDIKIGEALLFYIDLGPVLDYGESLFYVMDAHSQDLADAYLALFDEEGDPQEYLFEYDIIGSDLLYVDYICLYPEYRGREIGRLVMLGLIERFGGGAKIIVTEPAPLVFSDTTLNEKLQLKNPSTKKEWKAVKKKITDYWKPLGFRPTKKNKGILFLSMARVRPTVRDWIEKLSKKD